MTASFGQRPQNPSDATILRLSLRQAGEQAENRHQRCILDSNLDSHTDCASLPGQQRGT